MNRQKALMKKYLSRPENRYCADCKRPSPTWASLNLGVFVCIKCSGCHREIGVHITKIKSVELDLWPSKALTDFSKINNEIANAYWEYDLKNYDYQRIRDNEIRLNDFIRDKYEFKRWVKPRVPDPMSLVIQGRDLVKEFANNGEVVKMYEKSQEPELENRSQHFGRHKIEKRGKSFGIVDKGENNNNNENNNLNNNRINNNANTNINNNNNNNTVSNNNVINNNNNINQNNNNKTEKGFVFIKRKQNNNNNSNANTNNNVDLLGFGNDQNEDNINNNNSNQLNSENNNNFQMDIFSILNNQTNLNNNNPSNSNNINNNNFDGNKNQNNISLNNTQTNNEINQINVTNGENKPKSGFPFIKKKNNINQNQNNPITNQNNINNVNNNPTQDTNNNNNINNIFNNNSQSQNININNTNNLNQNQDNNNNQNNTNNNKNIINIFEEEHLVDLFNVETPTSDAVLNLSKNLLDIYSQKEEDKNNNNSQTVPTANNLNSPYYSFLNMNYPNININNYYPNNQQNKNEIGMMNNNYAMNPMMGYNYQPQPFMNNNFGFWYGYGMNNMNGKYMNMGMNNGPINPGFNYQVEFNKDIKKEKDEPKPILLNNSKFELNMRKEKVKEDPFKNLVNFK